MGLVQLSALSALVVLNLSDCELPAVAMQAVAGLKIVGLQSLEEYEVVTSRLHEG